MNNALSKELEVLLDKCYSAEVADIFRENIEHGGLVKERDPQRHLCVYFAACDFQSRKLFIGHHKKSGLWLFNGGHVDAGESLLETAQREIEEEWGLSSQLFKINQPALLTATDINNPTKQVCRLHLDVWYFIDVRQEEFAPDHLKIATEFYEARWLDLDQARKLITDKNTLVAVDFIEANYFNN